MKILAFESSCDDTAVAIVEDGVHVIASVRQSQPEHGQYGGVVPEVAARLHAEHWPHVLEECLKEAELTIDDIDALAVTAGPGLQTSLLNGTTAASFLSLLHQKPLIPVQHVYGHICSNFLGRKVDDLKFPALVLTVSGGHTDFYLWKDVHTVEKIGGTLDDAAGEAFDKVAKMLDLGYPGGPIVSKYAEEGNPEAFDLPVIMLEKDSLNFSFSGLKAAIYRIISEADGRDKARPYKADICASFQACVVKTFEKKVIRALNRYPDIKMLHFVGGVSANKRLREALSKIGEDYGAPLLVPTQFEYCTDNAAMIASAAYWMYKKDSEVAKVQFVDANPRLGI